MNLLIFKFYMKDISGVYWYDPDEEQEVSVISWDYDYAVERMRQFYKSPNWRIQRYEIIEVKEGNII